MLRWVLFALFFGICASAGKQKGKQAAKSKSPDLSRGVWSSLFFFFQACTALVNISRIWTWVCVTRHSNKVQNLNLLMQPQSTMWHVHCCWLHCCCVLQDGVIALSGSKLIQMAWTRWSKGKTLHLDDDFEYLKFQFGFESAICAL